MSVDVSKISKLLEEKWDNISFDLWERENPKDWSSSFQDRLDEKWTEYLNAIDCIVLTREDIREDLESIINQSSRGRCCIETHFSLSPYILMPIELAKKILVLNHLPDAWFPEDIVS